MQTIARSIAVVVSACLLPAWAWAVAPEAKSNVYIDWSSFSVVVLSDGAAAAPVLTWSNFSSTVNGYRPDAVSIADWTTNLTKEVSGSGTLSRSAADASTLHSGAEDSGTGSEAAGAWTLREGEFLVAGNGSVRMSVNYSWVATLYPPDNQPFSGFAYAFAALGAETRNDPPGGDSRGDREQIDVQLVSSFPSDIGERQGEGALQIEMPVHDGDHFFFTAQVSATGNITAVPWPPTAPLFLVGLCAILGRVAASRRWALPNVRAARITRDSHTPETPPA